MLISINFIRHAKTQGNLEHRYIGKTDESICSSGRAELLEIVQEDRYPKCEVLFTSPMRRCIETAMLIYPNMSQRVEHGLCECDFGAFEGKTYQELKDDRQYQRFLAQNGIGRFPDGEDSEAFRARSCAAFERIMAAVIQEQKECASIVCHGGTIMAIMSRFCEHAGDFFDYHAPNCGGYSVVLDTEKMKFSSCRVL